MADAASTFVRPQDAYPDPEAPAKALIAEQLIPQLLSRFDTARLEAEGTVYRKPSIRLSGTSQVRGVAEFLRHYEALPLNYCRDATAIDWLTHFEIVYVLANLPSGGDLVLRIDLTGQDREAPTSPSLCDLWPGADYMEREAYDMYGIRFEGHPNLRRILLQDEFIGFPLRKDYPWKGRVEDLDAIQAVLPRGWRDMLLKEEEKVRAKNAPKEALPAPAATAAAPAGEIAVKPEGPVAKMDMAERIRLAKALSAQRKAGK